MNQVKTEIKLKSGQILQVVQGDLTLEKVDAIVNAANQYLSHGGGVAGAIVRRGGEIIQTESDKLSPVPTGKAAVTSAGKLPAKMVIHAVGPVFNNDGDEDELLYSAVNSSLQLANEKGAESISIPAISSGIFGFPKDRCAKILFDCTLDFFKQHPQTSVKLVRFCNIDAETVNYFVREFEQRFPKGNS